MSSQKKIIIITGPTAVGKTSAAIEIAKRLGTEIISADSRQCFKELNIGVARPNLEELSAVKHHFIASHSIQDEMNAVLFEKYALEKVEELFTTYNTLVMVGGTGLYIKAFCEGLDEIPDTDINIRKKIMADYEEKGLDWLQQQVKEKDPLFYKEGEWQNPQRLMRALEVIESTGKSIQWYKKKEKKTRPFQIVKFGLELPREELNSRIDLRVDKMLEQGLLEEVRKLYAYKHLTALQTVGYSEIFDCLDNKINVEQAIALIKTHTRQYAKRQMTWFKKDAAIQWLHPDNVEIIID